MEKKTLFWDVDTQYDFMMPDGQLYVEGAEEIIPTINALRAVALDHGCSLIGSMDWHSEDNPEISENPDFQTTFPRHCMADTPGAQRVGYLGKLPIQYVEREPHNPGELAELVRQEQFHVIIRKEELDVFSNPNTSRLLDAMPSRPERIVVFGVTLDLCVRLTLEGLSRFRDIQLLLVEDGTQAIDSEAGERALDDLQRRSVQVVQFSQLREMVPCG